MIIAAPAPRSAATLIVALAAAILLTPTHTASVHTASNLLVEHASTPIHIDVERPRLSWHPVHPQRGQVQESFRVSVYIAAASRSQPRPKPLWDSGTVVSNATHVLYSGPQLANDADYIWSVQWSNASGSLSSPAFSKFSTALISGWGAYGSEWVSSSNNGSLNLYRATVQLAGPVSRARLYIAGLGYYKTTINQQPTDSHELGQQSTFPVRVLYDAWDVQGMLREGCNTLGVAVGHGWASSSHARGSNTRMWDRQFIALLSVTLRNGSTVHFPSSVGGGHDVGSSIGNQSTSSDHAARGKGGGQGRHAPLLFTAGQGPVTYDDIFSGEAFDGRAAQALKGWDTCSPPAGVATQERAHVPTAASNTPSGASGMNWEPATKPSVSPADLKANMSAHTTQTVVLRDHAPRSITQPFPGVHVYDFGQNMAGKATLCIRGCAAGTIIRLRFGEITHANGTVHNQFPGGDRPGGMARMLANYTCSGGGSSSITRVGVGSNCSGSGSGGGGGVGVEVYTTQFTSFGFQFVQVENLPNASSGAPHPKRGAEGGNNARLGVSGGEHALVAHSLGPNFPRAGWFNSSSAVLNAVQHSIMASVEANWANDVPTDCPHRERRGYLGDGQHAMETVVANLWSAPGYTKWLRDFRDQQQYDNATLGAAYNPANPTGGFAHGRIGGVAPFNVAQETDSAWGIAAWLVPAFISEYYDDDRVVLDTYPSARWQMEHWIDVALSTQGFYEFDMYGDFGNTDTPANEYITGKTQYFYWLALKYTAQFAAQAGDVAGNARYTRLASEARQLYMARLYNGTGGDGCFGNCTYVNQIFGLSLEALPSGSAIETAAWGRVLQTIGTNATDPSKAGRFGGGIVTLKLVYPLFAKFGEAALALRTLLHTDRAPSLGFMTAEGQSNTTLHEAWSMKSAYQGSWVGSFNHVMMASPGRWFYALFAGITRAQLLGGDGQGQHLNSRPLTWRRLTLAPPRDPAIWRTLNFCGGALTTPAGEVAVTWQVVNETTGQQRALYEMNATVPVTARATLVVPTVVAAGVVTVREGVSGVVWDRGAKTIPSASGIFDVTAGDDGVSVQIIVGSGRYALTVVCSVSFA